MGKMLVYIAIGLNMAGSLAGLFLTYQGTLGHKTVTTTNVMAEQELHEEKEKHPEDIALFVYTMDQMVVNLSGTPRRAIRIKINVEMLDAEGFEEVITAAPKAKDSVLQILSAKTLDDLEGLQGKLILKDQITTTLNASMRSGIVKDIYFSDFVMQ